MEYCKPNELYHHGILGQRWGKRNGPPYPLGASDHSASEKRAGWRKSLVKDSHIDRVKKETYTNVSKTKGLTSEQKKRLIKIGASVVIAGLAAYGGYRLYQNGSFDMLINNGKDHSFLSGENPRLLSGSFPEGHIYAGLPKLPDSKSQNEVLKTANPYKGIEGRNNCVYSAIAGFLRSEGVDVTARPTPGGEPQNGPGVAENVFKALADPSNRRRIIEGSAMTFGRSREDAERMLLKRFGENAKGFVNVQWKEGGGHAFNFEIVDGVVRFMDYRFGLTDEMIMHNHYWDDIDTSGSFSMIRLDGLIPNKELLAQINDIHE